MLLRMRILLTGAGCLTDFRRYDSTHGKFQGEVHGQPDALVVNGNSIKTFDKMCATHSLSLDQTCVFKALAHVCLWV